MLLALQAVGQPAGFGVYENASAAVWDGWQRYSEYVPSSDGTRLAVDYLIPTRGGAEPDDSVPVVLRYTRHMRAIEDDEGNVHPQADFDAPLQHLLTHGYAVAVVDARGTGASFGVRAGPWSAQDARDAHAVIQWLASRPWSNGRVGMVGRAYEGMIQYQAAARAPPALKAIFAEMAAPSVYDFLYRGGAFKQDFAEVWGTMTHDQDLGRTGTPARVDADRDGSLRDRALAEHTHNVSLLDVLSEPGASLRSFELDREGPGHWSWQSIHPLGSAAAIEASGVGIYHVLGWYDIFTTQQAWLYASLDGAPQKMMIGPWLHAGGYGGTLHKAELLRWFDYWLKGIDNGVLEEPPVHYYVMQGNQTVPDDEPADAEDFFDARSAVLYGVTPSFDAAAAEESRTWTGTSEWPPAGVERPRLYFAAGPTGSVQSRNDGALMGDGVHFLPAPAAGGAGQPGADRYIVDYTSSVGSFSRWMEGYGARRAEPRGSSFFDERTAEDRKALTYTTEPLEEAITIVGYPTVRLWVTSSHSDGDFFAYLEEIDGEGRAHYVSEGVLRASHRKTSTPPFDNFGLPFHRSYGEDIEPLVPGEPAQLDFDLMGTAIVIDAGHRIRVTIAGADAANFEPYPDPEGRDAPSIEVLRGGEEASFLELPIMARGGRGGVAR